MDFFSMPFGYRRKRKPTNNQNVKTPGSDKNHRPAFESLEERTLMTCNTISGHVFQDANSNGLFDPGETPIANSELELRDNTGKVVASATTDANGYYEFTHDETITADIQMIEQSVTIPTTLAGYSMQRMIDQFDPDLGQLVEVEVISEGSITSDIRAENSSTLVGAKITGTVSGTITLNGPGVNIVSTVSENAGSFDATAFDGSVNFDGTSGKTLAPMTAVADPNSIKLTGPELQAFIGTGQLEFTQDVDVTSTATGGGNLMVGINSSATTSFIVRYKYIPNNCLTPGDYTIVQKEQPLISPNGTERYTDGQDSSGGVVIPDSIGKDEIPVTLSDTDITHNDFGETQLSSLSGFVYRDMNNDGLKGLGEAGIAGVNVLLTGVDDLGNAVNRTTTTDANGFYKFDQLMPGNYQVNEEQPVDYLDGIDSVGSVGGTLSANDEMSGIDLDPGVHGENYNFGELPPASLSGHVYHDANNNGIKDAGEQGISGASVFLSGTDDEGPVARTVLTDDTGAYKFEDLRPGTYTIDEVQPMDYLDGKDRSGTPTGTVTNDSIGNINLGAGVNGINHDFGEIKGSSVSGFVYNDSDNDGLKDLGELGIPGVELTLTGTDDLGAVTLQTVTDENGFYEFTDLRPGTYKITETQPASYTDGKDTLGTAGGVKSSNDVFSGISLGQDVHGENYNFGERRLTSISGSVYHDANNNGVRDPGETGIAGTTVELIGSNDVGVFATQTTTDANGNYQFNEILPATYRIREVQPSGYLDGKDSLGSMGGTVANDEFTGVVLSEGDAGTNYNFGEVLPASLSGFVYEDNNDNGFKDLGESGIEGVEVNLLGSTDEGMVNLTTTTNADGSYKFENLRPGNYTIQETQPSGYMDGKDTVGTPGGILSANDTFSNVVLNQGVNGQNNNFGERIMGDVGIVKTVSSDRVLAGGTVIFTLTVTNHGPSKAENVVVEDFLPPGMTFTQAEAAGWLMATTVGGGLTFTKSSLASGESSVITITAQAPLDDGTYVNNSVVTSSTPDSNPDNNFDDATFVIQTQISPPQPPVLPPPVDEPPLPPGISKASLLGSTRLIRG